ncbi:MAG: AIR synthase-related protein, partial [Candidatus Anstonellaceae archaeon]
GLTDNGAGGLSSSIGELALLTNGAVVHLERCPLKYSGLEPWEIFLSESQERMTVAVPPAKAGDFVALAKKHNVEVSDIGEFNNSGYLKATYFGKTVLFLNLKFLHKGVPKLKLKALEFLEEKNPSSVQIELEEKENYNFEILELLSSLNITSKEWVIRQYDHEVLGMSVIKPLCGLNTSSPTDGAVVQPFFDKNLGIAVANGICPKFSDFDCYLMATNAVDEAVRNYISIGGDIEHWAALDNFCWPDPIKSETNPDGEKKLAQLVRANMGLAEISKAYSLPLISGKDSMKNDYVFGNTKISIPPTLLITLVGVVSDINTCLSSDFKNNSDSIYLLGKTYGELGGSEYAKLKGLDQKFFVAPKVRLEENLRLYKHLSKAIKNNLLNSCHDCSDGGLAIALAESCIGSDMGAFIDLSNLKELTNLDEQFLLFSESAGRFVVSVPKTKEKEFEKILNGCFFVKIGQVKKSKNLLIVCKNKTLVNLSIEDLKNNFKNTLKF